MNEDRTVIMSARALSPGHEILWYTIDEVLGQGGFGITYLAQDRNLDRMVAIKEYLPTPFAYRHQDMSVKPLTGDHDDNFAWGLDSFLKEAQTLAKFGHDNIVRVHSVFEANSTAYMVMEYEHGENLASIYKNKGASLDQGFFERTFFPIFDGLEQIHAFGFIHRDIKPANIYIRENGTPVLIDFGSARQTSQQQTGEMTTLVSKGYTPLEQYSANYGDQGPWTDIYALAATLYEGITGLKPDESLSRSACMLRRKPDLVQQLMSNQYPAFDQSFLDSTISGLALEPEGRPQSLSAWLYSFENGVGGNPSASLITPSAASVETVVADIAGTASDISDFPTLQTEKTRQPRRRHVEADASIDFDFDADQPHQKADGLDLFGDDFERPASGQTMLGREQAASVRSRRPKRKKKTGRLLSALLGVIAAVGIGYYFLIHQSNQGSLSADALEQLPFPASAISTSLPKEQVLQELGDLMRLSGAYQQGLSINSTDAQLLSGVDSIYGELARIARQWHASRHTDVHDLIAQVLTALPVAEPARAQLLASLQPGVALTSVQQVNQLLVAGQIASPNGASVLDEVNRLSQTDYASLTNLPEWQSMMDTLSLATVDKLEQRDFVGAARVVEAALSLEPDNEFMIGARAHLGLR